MKAQKLILIPAIIVGIATVHAQTALSAKMKTETIENISKSLKETYVFPDTAAKMGDYIRHQLKTRAYDTIKSPAAFASKSHVRFALGLPDGHLSVEYSQPSPAGDNQKPNPEIIKARRLKFRKSVNFGFEKAEILQGNIGYIKITGFFSPDSATKTMVLAMLRFISNSDALIIDLRG